jgi:F-type H+-transporting ATPase subunit b
VKRKSTFAAALVVIGLCLVIGTLAAQQPSSSSSSSSAQTSKPEAQGQAAQSSNPDNVAGSELAGSAGAASGESKEENAQFKYSKSVLKFGRLFGLGPQGAYMLSWTINLIIVIAFFYYLLRTPLPKMLRDRTVAIQKGIREAQAASAEASRRLADIEARLGRLDKDIAEIRAAAEREAEVEEERIRLAAEEDKRKVVESAETEIEAIARNARRELKAYAADLAVDLAARKIHVDDSSDKALVHEFVDQLGRDGS